MENSRFFEDRIPNLEELKIKINYLENLNLSDFTVVEIQKILDETFPIILFTEIIWDDRFHIYRARRNVKNAFRTPFEYISQIGIPEKADFFGRANNINEPIFYGSHNGDLTLFECCQNIGAFDLQHFTMGIWKVKQNQKLRMVLLKPTDEISQQRIDLKKISDDYKKNLDDLDFNIKEYSLIVADFFSKQFTKSNIKSNDDYKISAYFSNYIQNLKNWSNLNFDGIIYPSVANKFRGENVAIFKESLHKIEFKKALSLTCYNFDNEKGSLTKGIFEEGYLYGEKIVWKKKQLQITLVTVAQPLFSDNFIRRSAKINLF